MSSFGIQEQTKRYFSLPPVQTHKCVFKIVVILDTDIKWGETLCHRNENKPQQQPARGRV